MFLSAATPARPGADNRVTGSKTVHKVIGPLALLPLPTSAQFEGRLWTWGHQAVQRLRAENRENTSLHIRNCGHSAWQKQCFKSVCPLGWGPSRPQVLLTWLPQWSTEWTSQSSSIRHQATSFSFLTLALETGTFSYVEKHFQNHRSQEDKPEKLYKKLSVLGAPEFRAALALDIGRKGP